MNTNVGRSSGLTGARSVAEEGIDLAVDLPVLGIRNTGPGEGDVAERPEALVGEAVVQNPPSCSLVSQTRRSVYEGSSGGTRT